MKSICVIFLWILFFYACTQESVETEQAEADTLPISFAVSDTDGGSQTRGTPLDSVQQMVGIRVFCAWTGTYNWTEEETLNKMFNVLLLHRGDEWLYADSTIHWGSTSFADHYTFFGYTPDVVDRNGMSMKSSQADPGIPVLSYTVPTIVANQPDLMVAVPLYDLHPTGMPVRLNFRHALTCVGFQLTGNNQPVSSIKITGVSVTGNLKMDGSNIVWSNLTAPSAIEFSAGLNTNDGIVNSGPTLTDVMDGNGYLMMIPQTLESGAKVIVTFSDNSFLEYKLSTQNWLPGQKITYAVDTRAGAWAGAWAGSNIYWDGTKLTFDDIGDRTHSQYMGVYFMWGSLVALTPSGVNWTTGIYQEGVSPILYIPNPDPATNGGWDSTVESNTQWGNIPRAGWDGTTSTGTSSNPNNGGSASDIPPNPNQTYLIQIHDSLRNIGDICKYLTEKKWAPGAAEGKKWRMPTARELQNRGVFNWNSGASEAVGFWGTSLVEAGRTTTYANGYTFFPAGGFRQNYDAVAKEWGVSGSYWSSSPAGSLSSDLYFYATYEGTPSSYRNYGFNVRCVLDQ